MAYGLGIACLFLLPACEKKIPTGTEPHSNSTSPSSATVNNLLVQNPTFFASLNTGEQVFIAGSDGTIIRTDTNTSEPKMPAWHAATTSIGGNILALAAHPDKTQLVAVGENGLILYSADKGKNWKVKPSHTPKKLTTILFDAEHNNWIAGGDEGVILRSTPNNIDNWKHADFSLNINLNKLYYLTNRKMVFATGENGLLMQSTDGGQHWTTVPLPTTAALNRLITIDNTIIIACADGKILRSENNIENWELISTGSTAYLTSLIQDPQHNTLVVTSANGEVILSDDEGKMWAPVANAGDFLNEIIWVDAAKKLLIAGDNGVHLQSDNGGRTWKKNSKIVHTGIDGLMVIKDQSVVAYGEGGLLMHSNNAGDDWKIIKPPVTDFVHQILKTTTNNWLAVGAKGLLLISTNQGQDWQPTTSTQQASDYFFSIIHDKNSNTLITTGPPGTVLVSTDQGQTWRVRLALSDANQGYFHRLLGNNQGTLVALAGPGTTHYSTDAGETWAKSQSDNSKHLFAGTYDTTHQQFVAVGQGGAIQISPDGKAWQVIDAGISQNLQTVYADGGTLWIGGEQGLILRSDDTGLTWKPATHTFTSTILAIQKLRSGTLLATGNNGLIMRLPDTDKQWQYITNPATDMLRDPVQDPNTNIIYIASRSGTILYSADDGQHWSTMEPFTQASIKTLVIDSDSNNLLGGGERLIRIPLLMQK